MSPNSISVAHELIPAGDFSSWLRKFRESLRGENGMDVACGKCVGCCTSSYFILIRPHEKEAISRIPNKILFPAPGHPKGHLLMGYDKSGLCPMMNNSKCAIYEYRPLTCREYDCRIFAAAGILPGGKEKIVINQQVARWSFGYPSQIDYDEHRAVKAAARFMREHAQCFPGGRVPDNPSQLAILAIKSYDVFIGRTLNEGADDASTFAALAGEIVEACRRFDMSMQNPGG